MYSLIKLNKDRRREIVHRDGPTTKVVAAQLKDYDGVAFAVRFLMDHYLYKHSKVGGVQKEKILQVIDAVQLALSSFVEEVAVPQGVTFPDAQGVVLAPPPPPPPVSRLGEGVIRNPYDFV